MEPVAVVHSHHSLVVQVMAGIQLVCMRLQLVRMRLRFVLEVAE